MTDFSEITSCLAQAHILLQSDLGKRAKGGFTVGLRGTGHRVGALRAEDGALLNSTDT